MSADQAGALGEALLHLYQAKTESLQQRVNELIQDAGSPAAVAECRGELHEIDQTIDQLGWDTGERNGPVEVTAPGAVLREATAAAIDDAGERLSGVCTALLRGDASPADVRAQLETLRGLVDLLEEIAALKSTAGHAAPP